MIEKNLRNTTFITPAGLQQAQRSKSSKWYQKGKERKGKKMANSQYVGGNRRTHAVSCDLRLSPNNEQPRQRPGRVLDGAG
eukprot:scaffold10260_cov266-Chaetoceros_neogracile.AAC.55